MTICGPPRNSNIAFISEALWLCSNAWYQRFSISSEVDERTLREIYLPAFRAAVQEAGVLSVMGAYNRFRGEYCCESDYLLNRVLKQEWPEIRERMARLGVHRSGGRA